MEPQHWKDTIPPFHRWCHGFPRCTVWGGKERGISQAEIEDLPRLETPLVIHFQVAREISAKYPSLEHQILFLSFLKALFFCKVPGQCELGLSGWPFGQWQETSRIDGRTCGTSLHHKSARVISIQSDNRHSWRYVSCWWKCNSVFGCWGSFPTWSPAHQESLPAWWGVVMGGGSVTSLYHFCVPEKTALTWWPTSTRLLSILTGNQIWKEPLPSSLMLLDRRNPAPPAISLGINFAASKHWNLSFSPSQCKETRLPIHFWFPTVFRDDMF